MRTLLIAAAALAPAAVLAPASSLAQDGSPAAAKGNAVADAFLGVIDGGYDGVTAGAVRDEGGATVLTDVAGTDALGGTLSLGTVRIENGAAATPGLTADRISYENAVEMAAVVPGAAQGQRTSIGRMEVTGATLGGSGTAAGPGILAGAFDGLSLDDVAVDNPGSPFSIASVSIDLGGEGGSERTLDFDLTDLTFVASELEGGANMAALGYEELVLDVSADGGWTPAGALSVETVKLAADDAGTLTMSLAADGVTQATVDGIQAAAGDFAAILGLTQAINLRNVSLVYDDAGLVDRVLDQQAADLGVDRAAIVEQSVASVSDGLGALNMPEFAATVTDALRSFLGTPGTLSVSATPAAAVPLAQVIGGAMMAPQSLPALLNLEITAAQ